MTVAIFLLTVTLLVSYANGANDNFKGVATLYGSGTTSFRTALLWANVTTTAGALFAVVLGVGLAKAFGGKGLVPDDIVASSSFLLSVGIAAGGTVLLASRLGLPISTTHALLGALTGTGLVAAPHAFQFAVLGPKFLLPLIVSPLAAFGITWMLYPVLSYARKTFGIEKTTCACAGVESETAVCADGSLAFTSDAHPSLKIGKVNDCAEKYEGRVFGVSAQRVLDVLHFGSAGAVGFARGLNDAPKIAAIAFASAALPFQWVILLTGIGMLAGGALGARRVAETMSNRITTMNDGQGFTANLVTASLVFFGSAASLPMSTTHVSCGALFGLGAVTKGAKRGMILRILGSWIATLPIAALLGAGAYLILNH